MGDLLMSMPAVHALRERFPQARTTLLMKRELIPLLEEHPDIDGFLPWEEGPSGWRAVFSWAKRLRGKRFDCIVVMNPTRFFHAAAFLAGLPIRVGYRRKWGFLLTHSLPDTKAIRRLHETAYNLELVSLLGGPSSPVILSLPDRPALRDKARRILLSYQIPAQEAVALHPWTSRADKSWPLCSFQELARQLASSGKKLVLIGEPTDRSAVSSFSGFCADLTGRVPLKLLPALLRECRLLISNDSGPAHVAAAVGTRTIVVAPQSHAQALARWRPLGKEHVALLSPTVADVARLV